MQVCDVMAVLEEIAPSSYAFGFDRIGLQIGSKDQTISRVGVCLDSSVACIDIAAQMGCDLLIAHHPVIWEPLKAIDFSNPRNRAVASLIKNGMSFVACHTNWDCAPGGINDVLAERLGLKNCVPFGSGVVQDNLKLTVFVPNSDGVLQSLISALSTAGAGQIGNYSRCAYFGSGTGTFLAGEGSNPVVGERGTVVEAQEVRLEMVVPKRFKAQVLAALRLSHPYEEPAYDFHEVESPVEMKAGRIGELPQPMSLGQLCHWADGRLATKSLAWGAARTVSRLAIVGGAADGEWGAAQAAGADAFLTGEVRQDTAVAAADAGFAIVQSGHFATENPGMEKMASLLSARGIVVEFIEPPVGCGGRPV